MKWAQMGLVSQPKRDRLGHPTSSPSIYSCSLWCGSGVPTKHPPSLSSLSPPQTSHPKTPYRLTFPSPPTVALPLSQDRPSSPPGRSLFLLSRSSLLLHLHLPRSSSLSQKPSRPAVAHTRQRWDHTLHLLPPAAPADPTASSGSPNTAAPPADQQSDPMPPSC